MAKRLNTKKINLNPQYLRRAFILSVPIAVIFIGLSFFGFISTKISLLCFAVTIVSNLLLIFPISSELGALRCYIQALAGGTADEAVIKLSEKDTRELAQAITAVHKLWALKNDTLEAQTLSDAAVFDTLPDPILMLDSEGGITNFNRAAELLLGKNILTHSIDRLFSTNIFIAAVEKVLKGRSDSESILFHAPEYSNRRFYAHITKLPHHLKGRAAAVVSFYDASKALSLEKMQSDFVANASHELRTPLSVISGFIETLQTTAHDDEDARDAFLGIMKEQTEYMSTLIDDLLSLSRLEMGQNKELKDRIDLHEVIDDITQALKIKAFQRSISINVNELNHIPKIIGDNQQIHQVLQNLLDNAVKYAPENSEVKIELKTVPEIPAKSGQNIAAGRAVSIAFNNKGPKINKEDLARLTEKFYRMQIHKDMKIKGTGLGLSIAKQVVLHHHGNLTVSSTAYNGITFTVYLPVKQS
ncbi:MAG: PAS domain-containing protein [Alphaproteobacteria bacterium]|nr:PAS domain-containing protein [Alphaproteobacteria bacterium]